MTEHNYYQILGVSKETSMAEIKNAYRRLALKYHPDTSKYKNKPKKFVEITAAYRVLSDPLKREAYERGSQNVVCDDPRAVLVQFWKHICEKGFLRDGQR
jgi:DnaJ-class molecular chaperone